MGRQIRQFRGVAHKDYFLLFCLLCSYTFPFFSPLLSVFHVCIRQNLNLSLTSCLSDGQLGKNLLKKRDLSQSTHAQEKNMSKNMCNVLSGQTSICTTIQGRRREKQPRCIWSCGDYLSKKGQKGVDVLGV